MEFIMPVFALIATPAVRIRSERSTILQALPMEHLGARGMTEARTLAEISTAVTLYGERIAAAYPGRSFSITVHIRRGDRKPRGFDAAYRTGALGTDRWVLMVDNDAEGARILYGRFAAGAENMASCKGDVA
ncbi:hypothetical protein HUK81_19000 [Komagataeibacter swingsii]|uniref:Uncharacterized protein n=2 Tax=Acetobacteraceae TaxID=433 RepID=A0A850PD09_9PROT|nr:hypothetical protein [Komagataeibacter rhaeticus]KDU94692.1 hypothetical protein GLUCORHAEAF1_12385 [Komagataeibacter rhaeticus AF1]NVN38901.1 hypothetical protein [Komagataeibacter swingsii]